MPAPSLTQLLDDVHLVRALTYSSYSLLMWDYLLTLDDEIVYVWKSPRSVVKYLFIGNRYVNLLVQPLSILQIAGVLQLRSYATCLAFSWAMGFSQFWSYGSVHFLVLLRVWIVCGRTRKITIALMVGFVLYTCASIALFVRILSSLQFTLNDSFGGSCGGQMAPSSFSWLIWTVEFLLEACLFTLMIHTLNEQKSTSEFARISRLIRGLYKHAIIFMLANTFSDVSNTIAWTVFAGTPLFDAASSFTVVLINITGQRLAVDLRRLHVKKQVTQSEVSREVEIQLAVFGSSESASSSPHKSRWSAFSGSQVPTRMTR